MVQERELGRIRIEKLSPPLLLVHASSSNLSETTFHSWKGHSILPSDSEEKVPCLTSNSRQRGASHLLDLFGHVD
jgi:hypothetical protein